MKRIVSGGDAGFMLQACIEDALTRLNDPATTHWRDPAVDPAFTVDQLDVDLWRQETYPLVDKKEETRLRWVVVVAYPNDDPSQQVFVYVDGALVFEDGYPGPSFWHAVAAKQLPVDVQEQAEAFKRLCEPW